MAESQKVKALYYAAPAEHRKTMLEIRRRILQVVPQAEEVISYGMPAFKVNGNIVAGIMAAKQTGSLIPLCHPIPLTHVSIDFELDPLHSIVKCIATAETVGRTGVEMEAMTAASIALLTIYDMLKAVDRGMIIESVRLLEKSGGKSGMWRSE